MSQDKYTTDKNYGTVRNHFDFRDKYRSTVNSICNLIYSIPKEIPVVFHNGSNYNYHFIIKELAKEFKR